MTGYDKLARLMADYPSLTIYRKFGSLSSKILLYMQAELSYLEEELEMTAQNDSLDPQRASFQVSWVALSGSSRETGAHLQHQKVVHIQEKLIAYHTMLLRTSKVLGLAKPQASDLAFLRHWLELPRGGDLFLKGIEAEPWESDCEPDLIALTSGQHDGDLARYVGDRLAPWWHHLIGGGRKFQIDKGPRAGFSEYSDDFFVAVGNGFCMVLSSVIPTISIFALCFVKSIVARLGVITAMSFLFSFVMMVIIRGRRVDVFAATTAFAAVQVVFVGGVNVLSSS